MGILYSTWKYSPLSQPRGFSQRWLCQGAPCCLWSCRDSQSFQPVSKDNNGIRIKKRNKKKHATPHILDIKGGFYSNRKCFHHFKTANMGTAWGSNHITYSALIKTNAISAYPLRPSVLGGFFCKRWGQNQIAHSLSNLILGFSFPRLINSHCIDRLGELELTN